MPFVIFILLLIQGCSSTPEKGYRYSLNDFLSGDLTIPSVYEGNEIDDDVLGNLYNQVKQRNWSNLALYTFRTLNPQDLTYYYLGVAAEGKDLYKSALGYYKTSLKYGEKGLTCKGILYDDCNDLDLPSEIHKSIERVKHKSRVRNITIDIDKPNSFFIIDNSKYKSGESVKLRPGKYGVRYYSDTLFSETEITLTSKGDNSERIALSLKDNSKDSFSLDYVDEMNKIGRGQVNQIKDLTKDFSGIGIRFSIENNIVKITTIIANGPADKANLKSEDVIKRINGKVLDVSNINKLSKLLKGSSGSKVTISVNRNGNVFDVDLVRNIIKNTLTMDDFNDLISWRKDVIKQLDVVNPIFAKLDRNTSLYKATNEHITTFNLIKNLLESRLLNINTVNFVEYLKLTSNLNNMGITTHPIPLYNSARLKGSELYVAEDINNLNCKTYTLATKNLKLNTSLANSEKSKHSSQYIKEYREIPNDRYPQIKSELRDAKYELEDAQYESSQSSGAGGSALLAFSLGMAQRVLENQLEEKVQNLQSRLRNTPRTIREEVKAVYYPIKNNISFTKDSSVEWMSINCNSGRVNTYKIIKEENRDFTLYEGVRSDDLNNLFEANQSTKDSMKQWSSKAFISLDDIEKESDNYLTSTNIINPDIESIKSKVKDFLYK